MLNVGRVVLDRGAELERSLAGVPEDRRLREIRRHMRTQSQFLRLRRTKIGLRDFRTVKVIGKGAFGEVSTWAFSDVALSLSHSLPLIPPPASYGVSVFRLPVYSDLPHA
jgi:hypothetical protein